MKTILLTLSFLSPSLALSQSVMGGGDIGYQIQIRSGGDIGYQVNISGGGENSQRENIKPNGGGESS